ncbi:protein SLC31A2-like isoform X2 [Antedon mediterranea]
MHMSFYFSADVGQFLFKSWMIETAGELFGAIIFVCVLAAILGMLSVATSYVQSQYKANPLNTANQETSPGSPTALLAPLRIPTSVTKIQKRRLRLHVTRSTLHLLQVITGYFLMLAVMTYNGYIAITIFIASTITYFVFSPFRDKFAEGSMKRPDSINTSSISGSSFSVSESNRSSYRTSI